MADILATVVVEFGEGADDGALVVVELDDAVNLDVDGKVKTSFYPGDRPGFIIHFDDTALRVGEIRCSSGMVTGGIMVSRSRTQQVQFASPGSAVDLPHIPAGGVSVAWYGRSPTLSQDGRRLTASGDLPAIGEASYSIRCLAYTLVPPPLSLVGDATWPVLVVVTMEAVQ